MTTPMTSTQPSSGHTHSRKRARFAGPPLQSAHDGSPYKRAKSDKHLEVVPDLPQAQKPSVGGSNSSRPAQSRMQTSFASRLVLDDFCVQRLSAPSSSEISHLVARCKGSAAEYAGGSADTKHQMYAALPSREHAIYLCEQANVVLLCHGFLSQQYEDLMVLVNDIYDTDWTQACSFRLSAAFAVLSLGMEASASDDVVSDSAAAYHLLARAAACLPSDTLDGGHSFLTATLFMLTYMLTFREDEENLRVARSIMDASARVCNKLGLNAEVPVGQRMPVQKQWRRVMFWQQMSCDLTIALLRLDETSLPLQEPDNRCAMTERTSGPTACLEWRQQCLTRCATPILKLIRTTPPPPWMYTRTLKLDVTMRDFPMPTSLRLGIHCSSGPSPSTEMTVTRAFISMQRDVLIIRLHHTFFLRALEEPGLFSYSHPHIASVLATYQNACQIVACLDLVMRCQPEACRRIPCLWTQAFAAVTSLCTIAAKIPGDALAALARPQVDKCMKLLRKVKGTRQRDSEKMNLLESLAREATQVYDHWQQRSSLQLSSAPWPSPTSSESSPAACDGSSLANMHPMLLRLLQQVKARAQAVRPEASGGVLDTLVPQEHTLSAAGSLPTPSNIEDDQRSAVPAHTWNSAPSSYFSMALPPGESMESADGQATDSLFTLNGNSWDAFDGPTALSSFDTAAGHDWATLSLPINTPQEPFPPSISQGILDWSQTLLNTGQDSLSSDRFLF